MIQPYDYYRTGEYVAETLKDVKATIKLIDKYAADRGERVFWRGQANHTWALASSLVRQLTGLTDVDDDVLATVEAAILKEAAEWVEELKVATYDKPLAKLAYLQHHHVPTRLLDFTSDPWMAIFFASEHHDDVDGRLFALIVSADAVLTETPSDTPWSGYGTDDVKIYDPTSAGVTFPRLKAQHGFFALGRLPSTQPYRSAIDSELSGKKRALLAEEVRRVLSIPFALSPLKPAGKVDKIPKGAKTPVGLTLRLHVNKASVRRDLAGVGAGARSTPSGTSITHQLAYPDVAGMVGSSKLLSGLRKGVLIV